MRVTNRMMTSNSLSNISRNKRNMSVKANQYQTGQKIQRPSEDPIVAVRSLKYRTQLTELNQYVDKNIPDAFSWMDVTESALNNVKEILTQMNTYCDYGANGTLESYDRNSIIETLTQYKEHIADMNNSDYAGRYVFTGYKTDTPMIFEKEETNYTYTINEKFSFEDIQATSYVSGGARYDENITDAKDYAGQAPTLETAQKIKLTYENTDDKPPTVMIGGTAATVVLKSASLPGGECYEPADDEIFYIKETGELILGKNYYEKAQKSGSLEVTYEKTNFVKGDVRPEHYFKCSAKNKITGEDISYSSPEVQKIQYEINFSQMLTVNTLGKDAIPTYIGSKIDEMIRNVNAVFDMDNELKEVNKLIQDAEAAGDTKKVETLTELKEQLSTERTLKEKVLQDSFSSGISMTQKAEEKINIAVSNHGSRYKRLELTEDRLTNQQTDFKEMLSNNDLVDIEDAIINYKTAETVYNASLSCAATIVKNTLLDFL